MNDVIRAVTLRNELADSLAMAAPDFRLSARIWKQGDPPHVWVFDLRQVLDGTLPYRQAERAASRDVLSELIAAYAPWISRADNPGFRFVVRPGGKPMALVNDGSAGFRSFNISHSAAMLAVAIAPCESSDHEVGVDMEMWAGESKQPRDALRAWTRQEAAWKCVGVGMTVASDAPDVAAALRNVTVEELTSKLTLPVTDHDAGPLQFELARAWSW
jgi:phosphopantetheinyl transferase